MQNYVPYYSIILNQLLPTWGEDLNLVSISMKKIKTSKVFSNKHASDLYIYNAPVIHTVSAAEI